MPDAFIHSRRECFNLSQPSDASSRFSFLEICLAATICRRFGSRIRQVVFFGFDSGQHQIRIGRF
jgi:hypothetical protein